MTVGQSIADGEGGQIRQLVFFDGMSLRGLLFLHDLEQRRNITPWHRGKILFYLGENFVGFHITGDRHYGIIRCVVLVVESTDVFDVRRVEVAKVAVEVMAVGIGVVGLHRKVYGEEQPVGLVQDIDPNLLFDHLALVIQILGREVQSLHAVGFEPKHRIEGGDRSRLDVFGVVPTGVSVEIAATTFDDVVHRSLGRNRRAFEHHVLEEMGKAGLALRL